MRWTELGAFTTIMRTHEGIRRSANWNWDRDAETTAHFRRFARIHEALVPELVAPTPELAASVSDESEPPVVVPGSLVGLVSLLGEPVVGALLVDRAVASPEEGLLSELWVSCPSGAAEEQAVSTDKLTAVSNE